MSGHQRHDKERLRELAQKERATKANTSASDSPTMPLFDKPCKVQNSNEGDDINQKIRQVLGEFSDFKSRGPKYQIGALAAPTTPQPQTSGSKFFKHPSTHNGALRHGENKSTHDHSRRSLEGSGYKSQSGQSSDLDPKPVDIKSGHGHKQRSDVKSSHDHKAGYSDKRSRDHSADSSYKTGREHRGHHSNHDRTRMPSDGGGGSEGGGGGGGSRRSHSSERSIHSKQSSSHSQSSSSSQQSSLSSSQSPAKPSFPSMHSPLSSQSKYQLHSKHSTSPSPSQTANKSQTSSNVIVPSPKKSPGSASKPVFQPKPSSGSQHSTSSIAPNQASNMPLRESTTPPNGIVSRGPLVKQQQKNKLPKLLIQSENNAPSFGIEGLHDIFNEMRSIPAPVSEINTPRKSEEKLSFQIPPKVGKDVTPPNSDIGKAKPEDEEEKSQVSSLGLSENSLADDLHVSDDSETEQVPMDIPSIKAPSVIATKKREVEPGVSGMSSGSDSSSDGSDSSSSSEGETSSSEGEEEEEGKKMEQVEVTREEEQTATPKETPSWGLGSFLRQLKQSSPEAPIPKKSSEKQKEIDETNDEMLDEILHTAITSQTPLKDIGHASTLPFPTDHLDPDFSSERHQNGADSGCDLPGNNDRTNTSLGSLGSPDTASTCSSTSSKPSSGKPEKKGRGRPSLSSMSDSLHRTSKSEGSDLSSSLSKSNSGASKSRNTPKKDSKRDKPKSAHDEKKRRKTDFKSKPTISDSDDSEIDVVTVTPGKVPATMANSIVDEDKDKSCNNLFSSPKASKTSPVKVPVSQEKEEKDNKSVSKVKEVKHKPSSHRKKERDKDKDKNDNNNERNRKKEHKNVSSSPPVSDSKVDVHSEKHVDAIIETTNEFKPPCLLSPFASPTKTPIAPLLSPLPIPPQPSCPQLTFSNGKPAIMVEINLSLLDHIPSSANSLSASAPSLLKLENKSSDFSETDKKSSNVGAKYADLSHKNADINPKSADVTPKSADNSQKGVDISEKCAKSTEKSTARSVEKSTKIVAKSAYSVDKSANSVERSANNIDKNANASSPGYKEEDMCDGTKDNDSQVTLDKISRSHKRKGDSERQESTGSKRHKSTSKSSKKSSSEDLHNGSQEGESEGGGKLRVGERRNSSSSTSSRHSITSSKSKKIKIEDKIKKEPSSPDKHKKQQQQQQQDKNDLPHQNGQDHLPFHSYNEESSVKSDTTQDNAPRVPQSGYHQDEKLESAERYLTKAKELKHLADKDKPAKFSLYIKSVLSFVQCGCAMEKEAISEPQKIFTMYHETLQLLKQVIRVRVTCIDPDMPITDKRLSVLLLRIQSLLCLKLFQLKRPEVLKFKKIIDADNTKTASAKSPHLSSIPNRSIGTPPPISPTRSPAGSIGSVGSQGSCDLPSNKLTNGNLSSSATTPMSSPGTINVSQRMHSVMQQYINFSGYLVTSHDLWLQADVAAHEFKEFFDVLDNTCGPLSLHSSVLQLVHYVNEGLRLLKDT
ncbi:AF4/FMR2 family member 4-like isoform X2 [Haliotis rufescens]|uniref:AF4/FMR2 family member 4-like isoform X2 n=1 Tax=Haliotis rufescens TaxID=6454 RepID=UPI00201F23B1|nr:AF4/FMR2 family member 4-like isoform X2 [Haliotis rufescens]